MVAEGVGLGIWGLGGGRDEYSPSKERGLLSAPQGNRENRLSPYTKATQPGKPPPLKSLSCTDPNRGLSEAKKGLLWVFEKVGGITLRKASRIFSAALGR